MPKLLRTAHLEILLAYGLLACLVVWRGHPIRIQIVGSLSDPVMSTWFLNWWPYALLHGLNPFVTREIWHAGGLNITWSTSLFFPALLLAPCTALFGALATYNVLSITAPAFAAWTCFLLLYRIARKTWPAFLGGCIFGFSSYETAQVAAHLNLSLIAIVPIAVLLCKMRYDDTIGRRPFVGLLAIAAVAQVGTSTEIMLSMSMFGLMYWVICLALFNREGRARLVFLAADIARAAVVAAIALTPFLFYLLKGLAEIPDEFNSPTVYSMDSLALIVPTVTTYLGGAFFLPVSKHFTGYFGEQGGYIGLPFAVIVILMFQMRARSVVAVNIMFGILVLASLGPRLHAGESVSVTPMPWAAIAHLPVFRSILPSRFSLYLALCLAILVALWLATPTPRWPRYCLAFIGLCCIWPDPTMIIWTDWPTDPFFSPSIIRQKLGPDANVLVLPFADTGPGMAWQLDAGMTFSQAAGYGAYVPRSETFWPAFMMLHQGVAPKDFPAAISAYCGAHRIDDILIGPGTPHPLQEAIAALGWQARLVGDVRIVAVPRAEELKYRFITGDYWPAEGEPGLMGHAIRVKNNGESSRLKLWITYRPPAATSPGFTVIDHGTSSHYAFTSQSVIQIDLPENADIVVRADNVYIPDRVIGNGDSRKLSFAVELSASPSNHN